MSAQDVCSGNWGGSTGQTLSLQNNNATAVQVYATQLDRWPFSSPPGAFTINRGQTQSVTLLAAGTYSYTTSGGCSGQTTVTVMQPVCRDNRSGARGATITLENDTHNPVTVSTHPGMSWPFSNPSTQFPIAAGQHKSVTLKSAGGTYYYDATGCSVTRTNPKTVIIP